MFHSEQLCVANQRGNGWGVMYRTWEPALRELRTSVVDQVILDAAVSRQHVRDDPEEVSCAQTDL